MKFKEALEAVKLVFSEYFYVAIAILVAFFVFSFDVLIPNIGLIFDTLTSRGFIPFIALTVSLWVGGFYLPWYNLTTTLLISILSGFVLSLIIFKVKANLSTNRKASKLGTLGFVIGVLAPGCSSCGIGLLALLGLGGAFSGLPFGGEEFGVIGILLLIISSYVLLKGISKCDSCQIQLDSKR